MNAVSIACLNTNCRAKLRVDAKNSGRKMRCPVCGSWFMAPHFAAAASSGGYTGGDDADMDPSMPLWKIFIFAVFVLAGLAFLVALSIGFEVWLNMETKAVHQGVAVDYLTANAWEVKRVQNAEGKKIQEVSFWSTPGVVWTLRPNGQLETGKLLAGLNRYDRAPDNGFRTWKWEVQADRLTLTNDADEKYEFVWEQKKEKKQKEQYQQLWLSVLKSGEDEPVEVVVVLAPTRNVDEFPGCGTVFYAGVIGPLFVTFLLSWLISREVFRMGCLRFILGWFMTVLLGVLLGAGAGFLLDMLNDHSHGVLPYWLLLSALQGGLAVIVGFGLGAMSSLRSS